VVALQYLGAETRVHVAVDERTTVVGVGPSDRYLGMVVGENVWMTIDK
jgi:hypothetical protein